MDDMPVTADEVRRRLPDAELTEVPLPGDTGPTWVVEPASGDDLVAAWTATRDAVGDLGLHPVAVTTWGSSSWPDADLFSRFYYGQGDDLAPDQVLARADDLSLDAARHWFRRDEPVDDWDEVVAFQLDRTEQDLGSRPDEGLWSVVPRGDEVGLERRLLDWEEERRPTHPPAPSSTFTWFDPRGDRVGLALLPVSRPADALAYLSFFGADGDGGHEALIRLAREWENRYGAELVANWGTMLQLVVARPPDSLDEAFDLAAEQAQVAPCTTVLPGEGIRHLARHLWRGERWFLHERP